MLALCALLFTVCVVAIVVVLLLGHAPTEAATFLLHVFEAASKIKIGA